MISQILFWIACALMLDSAVGMLGYRKFQRRLPMIPISGIAIAEAALAVVLLIVSRMIPR